MRSGSKLPPVLWVPLAAAAILLALFWKSPEPPPQEPPPAGEPAIPELASAPGPAPVEAGAVAIDPDRSTRPPLPIGWHWLDAPPAAPFLDAEFAVEAGRWVGQLGGEAPAGEDARFCSGAAMSPFVVVGTRHDLPLATELSIVHERFRDQILAPARLLADPGESWTAVVVGDLPLPEDGAARRLESIDPDSPRAREEASALLASLWLETLLLERGGERPPPWWCSGAIGIARAGSLADALRAPPPILALTAAFETPEDGSAAEHELAAASFAAFCLGANGLDEHLRATWLEFASARVLEPAAAGEAGSSERLAELAARFGCASFAELESRWLGARE